MKHIDVILFGGQSNMQGQTERLTNSEVIEGAYEYRFLDHAIKPLANPVGESILRNGEKGYTIREKAEIPQWLEDHVLGGASGGCTNLVPEFCRSYRAACGKEVLAIHAAKGSTKIAEWLPGSEGYAMLLRKAKRGIEKIRETYKVDTVLFAWLQGESDAIVGNSTEYYAEKITELKNALKEELGIEKFGIIRVGRFTNDEKDLSIMEAQEKVCRVDEDFLMLTRMATELCAKPEYMNPHVRGHYSATGLELLGADGGKTLGMWRTAKS
jgi:hypothetical protein